jgi:hypothetical protein
MTLRAALRNIHRDPAWWRKILIGGALAMTGLGLPWPAGMVVESMENIRRGFPTPLPLWREWGNRYIIGFGALLIDFVFYLIPPMLAGLVSFCVLLAFTVGVSWQSTAYEPFLWAIWLVLALYELAMFALGVSPVGRLIFIRDGAIEEALSRATLRQALHPIAVAEFRAARLRSLPAYLPFALLAVAALLAFRSALPGASVLGLLLLWLAASALLYAHLVVAQLYAASARALGL